MRSRGGLALLSPLALVSILLVHAWWVISASSQRVVILNRRYGSATNRYVFRDGSNVSATHSAHVLTKSGDSTVYLLELNEASVSNSLTARRINFQTLLVGPIGCYQYNGRVYISANCPTNSIKAQNNKILLESLWWAQQDSTECLLGGGDYRSCLGPPHFLFDDSKRISNISNEDMLYARGVSVHSGTGPYASIPTNVMVDMIMPKLRATTNDSTCSLFNGTYENSGRDAYSGKIVNATYIFARDDGLQFQSRILVFREDTVWSIILAEAIGTGISDSFFVWDYVSNSTFPSPRIPLNSPIVFVDPETNATNCVVTFSVVNAPYPPRILEPTRIDSITYSLNTIPQNFYRSRRCNHHIGAYDLNLELIFPYCPESTPCGGDCIFKTRDIPPQPIFIPPNPQYEPYVQDCEQFYPPSETFRGFGITGDDGAIYYRYVPDQQSCFAPFLIPSLILEDDVVNERYRQAFMLGGYVATRTRDVVTIPVNVKRCVSSEYIFFNGACYYKWDTTTQNYARRPVSEAAATCARLNFQDQLGRTIIVSPVAYVDYDTRVWLQNRFVYWKRQENSPYRFEVFDAPCTFVDIRLNSRDTPTDDVGFSYSGPCATPAYPLCSYLETEYEVIDRWIDQSPYTVQILRDGQPGHPHDGKMMECQCYNGWSTETCEIPTCPYPSGAQDPQSIFFDKCYANQRGRCENGDPRACQCNLPYAPFSSILPSPQLYAQSFPCAFPACFKPGNESFTINNRTYFDPVQDFKPCCGLNGVGIVDDLTNTGECVSISRVRTDDGVTLEPAYDGAAKSCRLPKLFQGENIVQRFCNNRGTCCPFGETVSFVLRYMGGGAPQTPANATASPSKESLSSFCSPHHDGGAVAFAGVWGAPPPMRRNKKPKLTPRKKVRDPKGYLEACDPFSSGCVCDNGATGEACTCTAAVDVAYNKPNDLRVAQTITVDLHNPTVVKIVRFQRKTTQFAGDVTNTSDACVPTRVRLQTSLNFGTFLECSQYQYQNRFDYWFCPSVNETDHSQDVFSQFVVVNTLQTTQNCRVEAFSDWFEACGNDTNPTAGRYFATSLNRGYLKQRELQPIEYAPYGCTNR